MIIRRRKYYIRRFQVRNIGSFSQLLVGPTVWRLTNNRKAFYQYFTYQEATLPLAYSWVTFRLLTKIKCAQKNLILEFMLLFIISVSFTNVKTHPEKKINFYKIIIIGDRLFLIKCIENIYTIRVMNLQSLISVTNDLPFIR